MYERVCADLLGALISAVQPSLTCMQELQALPSCDAAVSLSGPTSEPVFRLQLCTATLSRRFLRYSAQISFAGALSSATATVNEHKLAIWKIGRTARKGEKLVANKHCPLGEC